jgi:hypothetical protein
MKQFMESKEAADLEKMALNDIFLRFQERNHEQLKEMKQNVCSHCGDCTDETMACNLTASMTWHVFSIYFRAISGVN